MARTVIIDYDAGNLHSVRRACVAAGLDPLVSSDPADLIKADRVVFPGVGAAGAAMRNLQRRGLDQVLKDSWAAGTPMLGICLGLQISFDHSEEQDTPTLGLLPGRVRRFVLPDPSMKIPHMGWNAIVPRATARGLVHPVLADIHPDDEFFFVHAYYAEPAVASDLLAVTRYGQDFASVVGRGNYLATQFHTEKSGRAGLALLQRFANWDGLWEPAA